MNCYPQIPPPHLQADKQQNTNDNFISLSCRSRSARDTQQNTLDIPQNTLWTLGDPGWALSQ